MRLLIHTTDMISMPHLHLLAIMLVNFAKKIIKLISAFWKESKIKLKICIDTVLDQGETDYFNMFKRPYTD